LAESDVRRFLILAKPIGEFEFLKMSRSALLGLDGRAQVEERKSGPRRAGSGLPAPERWLFDHREPGRRPGPSASISAAERRALLGRLAEADEMVQDQIWGGLPWISRRLGGESTSTLRPPYALTRRTPRIFTDG